MKLSERIKYVETQLSKLVKKGLGTNIAMGGKTVEQLARNKNTIAQFDKQVKRQKERPKIEREVQTYQKKFEQQQKRTRKLVMPTSLADMKMMLKTKARDSFNQANLNTKSTKILKQQSFREKIPHFQNFDSAKSIKELEAMERKMDEKSVEDIVKWILDEDKFLEKYFKELRLSEGYPERIQNLKNAFGTDIAKFYDFVADAIAEDFKIYTDNNKNLSNDDPESYHQMMRDRLERLEGIAVHKYNLTLE